MTTERGGQPTKALDERLIAELEDSFAKGATITMACALSGLHRDTWYEWRRRAAQGDEPWAGVIRRLMKPRIERALKLVELVHKIALEGTKDDGTRLAAQRFQLERLYRDLLDDEEPQRVELSGPGGGPVPITHYTPEQAAAELAALLAKATGAAPSDASGGPEAGAAGEADG